MVSAMKRPRYQRVCDGPYFYSNVDMPERGCWNWQRYRNRDGYGVLPWPLPNSTRRRAHLAHRISFTLSVGPIPSGLSVLHRCDNPACVRPDHLWLGTPADNLRDCKAKGRLRRVPPVGEAAGGAKLTCDKVREIRKRVSRGGVIIKDLAREFAISRRQLRNIVLKRNWKHVQ